MAPSIVNILYNDFVKPYKRYILIMTMIVIFGAAAYFAFKMFAKPLLGEGMGSGRDVSNHNTRSNIELYFFFADWCPHCTKAKPQWATFKSAYDGKEVNGSTIKCNEVDCTDGSSPLIQKYGVNGYPTLIMLKNGDQISFDSKITSDNLTQFVNSI